MYAPLKKPTKTIVLLLGLCLAFSHATDQKITLAPITNSSLLGKQVHEVSIIA